MPRKKKIEELQESKEIIPAQTSPAGITNLSFGNDIEDYRIALKEEAELVKEKETLLAQITKYFQSVNRENRGGYSFSASDLSYAIRNVEFVKKQERPTFSEEVEYLRKNEGYAIGELMGAEANRKVLKKRLGRQSYAFLNEVFEAVQTMNDFRELTPDEERTQKVRKELQEFQDKLAEINVREASLKKRKETAKELISYAKDVASIAKDSSEAARAARG